MPEMQRWKWGVALMAIVAGVMLSSAYAVLTDPTQPPNADDLAMLQETPVHGFRLNAIIYTPPHPLAMINGQMYRAGETIDTYRIQTITETQVVLENQQKARVILSMPHGVLQNPPQPGKTVLLQATR